eukprot:Nitzschia sp. Nitz4//scaffold266_size26515//3664//4746//NITZ4_008253-RA/size26515-processed-gene-0.8-mRNA-1//-1//CDS//3329544856//6229//frame0
MMTAPDNGHDWRQTLFGPNIQRNISPSDEESPLELVPVATAFDTKQYDYIAVFIGANYCPHCKEFAPTVISSAPDLEAKKTKVVFASGDRDDEGFQASVKKNRGIDVMPYDLDRVKAMRDLFELKTIPALMILKNSDFHRPTPIVVVNGRHNLVDDPRAKNFPWTADKEEHMSAMDRFIIRGKYGKWWELGHHANPEKPDEVYMDEHAVRARAGILNIITWIALINVFFWKEPDMVKALFPIVSWEFLSSMTIGLTPLSPIGVLGTLLSIMLWDKPHWKPARPKRFAWAIGVFLATSCLLVFVFRKDLGEAYRPAIGAVVIACNTATWLESCCGFCLGCYIYNNYMTKWFHVEECQECKL